MPQTVSQQIYEAFFSRLAQTEGVRPETVQGLRLLYQAGRLADKTRLSRLVREVERRHAEDQNANR